MAKTQAQTPVATAVAALVPKDATLIAQQAGVLAVADASFADSVKAVATEVARVLTAKPSYDHWTLVTGAFIKAYATARNVKEDSARMRWMKVAGVLDAEFALTKPQKPTQIQTPST